MLAIPAILDIINIASCLFTQQTHRLSTRHVKVIFTTRLVAVHTRSDLGFGLLSLTFADVTDLEND